MPSTILTTNSLIKSESCEFPSRGGATISAYLDHSGEHREARAFIVMSPKYGESKKNNLQLAYYLAANGFTVLRFDFTCHFGESQGDMLDFTLPGSAEDIGAAFDYLERRFGVRQAILIASSLSSLPAFRMAAEDTRVGLLIGVVPAVNFADSIARVYQEDLIGDYLQGRRYGVLDILGHDVNMDQFCASLVEANMHDLEGTVTSLAKVRCPVTLLPAASDAWVAMEDVERVAACNSAIMVRPIEGAMHEVRENRAAAEALTREIISICRRHSFGDEAAAVPVTAPDKKKLFEQNRVERERLRQVRPAKEQEDEFWGRYLTKYRVMEKTGDYQQYLDLVGSQLGEFRDGELLLDAGCGNGLFGVWLLRELIQRRKQGFNAPPLYVGIDLTEPGLRDAITKHAAAERVLGESSNALDKIAPGFLYAQADLDEFALEGNAAEGVLRFQENCFDKIACSLLLSYLKNPQRLLNTLYRLLRPGGKIVISSMKPFCDLSAIYRDFVEEKAAKEDIEAARGLLRAAGAIKIKQEQGYYDFFSDTELTSMLKQAGFQTIRCFSSLGNQAFVAAAAK